MRRAFVVIALVCLLAPAGALGASTKAGGNRLIRDCAKDGEINGHYTQAQYTYAINHIPTDLDEYTNCKDAIKAARAAAAAGPKGGGGGTGAGAIAGGFNPGITGALANNTGIPTPAEQSAITNAAKTPGAPIDIGGGPPITPGGPGITTTRFTHAVPGSMLLVLILLSIAALGAASLAVRSRVLSRRRA
jgi:hypothetical protein